jgi:predicted membrane protein
MTNANWWRLQGAATVNTIYRGRMGKLLLVVLAVIAAFMILSIVISALHFIFWVAVVALIVVVGMRLTSGARRRSRR